MGKRALNPWYNIKNMTKKVKTTEYEEKTFCDGCKTDVTFSGHRSERNNNRSNPNGSAGLPDLCDTCYEDCLRKYLISKS
jgi:hypothetical protein